MFANIYKTRLATTLFTTARPSHIRSIGHFTPAEFRLYTERLEAKSRQPSNPVTQEKLVPRVLQPRIYDEQTSTWLVLENTAGESLKRGNILRVISWNIDWSSPGPAARASTALEHLKDRFGNSSGPLVVMLQEVRRESLQAILDHPWVQQSFILSNVNPPDSLYTEIPGDSFVLKSLDWSALPYFTIMMMSRTLSVSNCFRVPFVTRMGRDILVVDILISDPGEPSQSKELLRLCTTHLESLWEGKAYRPGQLALISTLLKGTVATQSRIAGGLVGGDMNAIDRSEHEFHKAGDVDLKDVWEDIPPPQTLVLKPFQNDLSYGRARGNTWGYQSTGPRERKRMDKFFYCGSIVTVPVQESQDVTGRVGRLGMGLKTEVEAWEHETARISFKRGKAVLRSEKEYLSDDVAMRMGGISHTGKELVHVKIKSWVSDHFAIAVGIKISFD